MKAKTAVIIAGIIIGGLVMTKKVGGSVIERMAAAIEYWESGGNPDALNYRNNNPGNLRWFNGFDTIPWAGATALDQFDHVVFDSYASGYAALIHQLSIAFNGQSRVYSPADTLSQFFSKYAEANSTAYAEYVAAELGVTPETELQNITVGA